jgi:hypothetical protein
VRALSCKWLCHLHRSRATVKKSSVLRGNREGGVQTARTTGLVKDIGPVKFRSQRAGERQQYERDLLVPNELSLAEKVPSLPR